MNKFLLDIRGYDNKEDIHSHIADMMDFPSYYGKNLDALYDVLTDINEYTCVLLIREENSPLEEYIEKLVETFEDAEIENGKLAVFICDAQAKKAL